MLGQPFVDERVVRAQQIEDAAILGEDALEEELGLTLEVRAPGSGRNPGTSADSGSWPRHRAGTATARRNCWPASRTRASASIRRTCCSSTAGSFSFPAMRHVQQLIVGDAAPEEERQTRGELDVADAIDTGGRGSPGVRAGSRSMRNRNCGLTRTRSSACSMPASNPPSARPVVVDGQQRLQIRVGDGPSIGATSQRRQNLLRAAASCGAIGRVTDEDSAAAGRVRARTGWILRALDRDARHARAADLYPEPREHQILARRGRALDERDADHARTCLQRERRRRSPWRSRLCRASACRSRSNRRLTTESIGIWVPGSSSSDLAGGLGVFAGGRHHWRQICSLASDPACRRP